jgi:hypothetical protein
MKRSITILLFSVFVSATSGCGGNSSTGGASGLAVFPATTLYTGVDEMKGYSVNVAVLSGSSLTWSSSDPSVASVTGNDQAATITALKAGTATITASAGGAQASIPLTVSSYTAAGRAAGEADYKANGCADCHDIAGGPDITPSDLGKHTDNEIITAFTTGQNPEGGTIEGTHSFKPTDNAGLVAYLRSLSPKQVPVKDE